MKDRLRISISGIRGKVPDGLDVEVTSKFASAFSSYLEEGSIAICRDYRFSSQMLQMAAVSAVLAAGLDCADFGKIPLSFLQFIMNREAYSGGIAVSGGHNPLPWNAVILLNEGGFYLEATEGPEVFNIYESENFQKASWDALGRVKIQEFPLSHYLEKMAEVVNVENIQKAGFKIVADPCNGVVSPFLKAFGEYFGLNFIPINNHPDEPFPHPPEPSPENASQVEAVVRASNADLGFLLDSDGSRISFVNEKGEAQSEEFTLPLCLLSLKDKIQKAVSTAATSDLAEWAAEAAKIKLLRTKVGQSPVVHTMEAEGAQAGGEGSGSFAYLPFSPGYDALLSLSLILDYMVKEEKTISELIFPFPKLFRKKIKIEIPPVKTYRVMDRLEEKFAGEKPDCTDGIKIRRKNAWFIIRPSTTEFILRRLIEGETEEEVSSIEAEIRERIEL